MTRPGGDGAWSVFDLSYRLGMPVTELNQFLDDVARTRGRSAVWTIDERVRSSVVREWWGDLL